MDTGCVAVVAVTGGSPRGGKTGVDGETVSAVTDRMPVDSPLGASLVVETTELGPLFGPPKVVDPNE